MGKAAAIPFDELRREKLERLRSKAVTLRERAEQAEEESDLAWRDVYALEKGEALLASEREDREQRGRAVRNWLDRQIMIGGVSSVERAVIERLADDLEAGLG